MTTWLLLLALHDPNRVAIDHVDTIERNVVECGNHKFDQVIFWRWDGERISVCEWRMATKVPHVERYRGGWRAVWFDGDVLRDVRARQYQAIWSNYDREIEDRDFGPQPRQGFGRR